MNNKLDSKKTKKHKNYIDNPSLFMRQQWVGYNTECFKISKIIPRGYQLKAIDSIHKNKISIIASSKQMGGTSLMSLYIAWYALFNENKQVFIMSNNSDRSAEILGLIKTILLQYSINSEFNFGFNITKNSKTELELDNGCNIKTVPANLTVGIGYTIDLLYIDNAAFIKNLAEIHQNLSISIASTNGKTILMSTPYDDSDFNLWALNSKDNQNVNFIEWPWNLSTNKDKEWYDHQCLRLGNNQKLIDTELNCKINYKEKSNKDKTISLRIDSVTYNKITIKAGSMQISDYIRTLIEKDLGDCL